MRGLVLASGRMPGQNQSAAPAFEAASVKPAGQLRGHADGRPVSTLLDTLGAVRPGVDKIVAHALLRAVSRLFSTRLAPGSARVDRIVDAARRSACATGRTDRLIRNDASGTK